MTKNKLVILDRDGVINYDSDLYIKSPEEWEAIESSLRAIARLNAADYKVAVATNQSGIGRGMFNAITLATIHKKMEMELASVGAHIDALEYCPDHPDQAGENRKPNTGMIKKLLTLFDVPASEVWFIGDSKTDIECALKIGCQPILVLTGKGKKTIELISNERVRVFDNLAKAVDNLLNL
ncbi:MAG: D-glycero-beta-D-manno-heptose 1,7-bisphosphate 7-phosphatase [Kangiellaceae bacterium]